MPRGFFLRKEPFDLVLFFADAMSLIPVQFS
jgi:hypothetical protein